MRFCVIYSGFYDSRQAIASRGNRKDADLDILLLLNSWSRFFCTFNASSRLHTPFAVGDVIKGMFGYMGSLDLRFMQRDLKRITYMTGGRTLSAWFNEHLQSHALKLADVVLSFSEVKDRELNDSSNHYKTSQWLQVGSSACRLECFWMWNWPQ